MVGRTDVDVKGEAERREKRFMDDFFKRFSGVPGADEVRPVRDRMGMDLFGEIGVVGALPDLLGN